MKASLLSAADLTANFWSEWDELNREHCANHPLLQSRMVEALTAHYPSAITPLRLTDTGRTVGLVLLRQKSGRFGLVRSGYLPSQSQIALAQINPNYRDFERQLFSALPLAAQRVDLPFVDSQYQTPIAGAKSAQITSRGTDMVVQIAGNHFEDYWQSRPRSLKKNISRYLNRVARELGDLSLVATSKESDMNAALTRYGFLESRGWKGENGTAIHPSNRQGRFYMDVLSAFASSGNARVYELYQGDHLLASRLTVDNGQLLVILKTTFDEDFRRYAPGRLLLHSMLQHVFEEQRIACVDFYTNATPDQLEWATDTRPIYDVSLYRHPIMGKAYQAIKDKNVADRTISQAAMTDS